MWPQRPAPKPVLGAVLGLLACPTYLLTCVVILRAPGRSMLRIAGVARTVQRSGHRP